eukprot:6050297-Amphidinium_carterae.1
MPKQTFWQAVRYRMYRLYLLNLAFLEELLQRLAPSGAFSLRPAPKNTLWKRTESPRADSLTFLGYVASLFSKRASDTSLVARTSHFYTHLAGEEASSPMLEVDHSGPLDVRVDEPMDR